MAKSNPQKSLEQMIGDRDYPFLGTFDGLPIVATIFSGESKRRGEMLVQVECPFCKSPHTHGAYRGEIGLSHRNEPCEGELSSYYILLPPTSENRGAKRDKPKGGR